MRSLKDEEEIAAIRKAQTITDAAFLEILDFIKPGKTEKEVAAYWNTPCAVWARMALL